MTGVWTVLAATAAAFVVGFAWYALVPPRLAAAPDSGGGQAAAESPPWALLVELARCLIVAVVMAWLSTSVAADGVREALALGAVAWVGFPVVLLAGSVLWEGVPARRAAIHAGDWLAKLLAVAVIVTAWG